MKAKSSIHICAAKSSAEIHNDRRKDMAHIRKDLTPLNEKWNNPLYKGKTMAEIRKDIEVRYKQSTHQTMQKKANPLREAVVNIKDETTMDDLRRLADRLQKRFGIKTIAIYTHRDEGHEEDGEWKTNHHAHMEFDWTDDTGRTIKLKARDMAQMQTIVAEALDMERGKSSDIEHLNAIQYKVKKQSEQNDKLRIDAANLQQQVDDLKTENETLSKNKADTEEQLRLLLRQVEELKKQVKWMKITKKGKDVILERLNGITTTFGKSKVQKNLDTKTEELKAAQEEVAKLQARVDNIQARLDRKDAEHDDAMQQLYNSEQAVADKDAMIASQMGIIHKQDDKIRSLYNELTTVKHEKRELERSMNPRMYAMPDVVDMNSFHIIRVPGIGNPVKIFVDIEGYRIKPEAVITKEDNRAFYEDRLSKEELVAKYFSLQIEAALYRRLRSYRGTRRLNEIKRIENTMFFRLPGLLNIPGALNVSSGSRCSENPNVSNKSMDELERELIDQGYKVKRGYGMS